MGHAIHHWKAMSLQNPNMVEFKCVTRVNSAQFTFKELQLYLSLNYIRNDILYEIFEKLKMELEQHDMLTTGTKFHEDWPKTVEVRAN